MLADGCVLRLDVVYNRVPLYCACLAAAHLQLSCSPQQLAGLPSEHGAHYELDARQKGTGLLS